MNGFVIQHPGKLSAAEAHHPGLNADRAVRWIPFGGGSLLAGLGELHHHPHLPKTAEQICDRRPLALKGRRMGDQRFDLLNGQLGIPLAPSVVIADPAIRQLLRPGNPVGIGLRQPCQPWR